MSCTCCALELVAGVPGCRTVGSPAAGQLGGTEGPAAATAPSDPAAAAAAAPAAADATVGGTAVELELDWS